MKLKFWQKDTPDGTAPRMSKPKEIPDQIGRYLVVTLKQNPDWGLGPDGRLSGSARGAEASVIFSSSIRRRPSKAASKSVITTDWPKIRN